MVEGEVFVECGADLNNPKYPFRRKMFMWPDQTDAFRQHYHNEGIYQTVMKYVNPIWIQDDKGRWVIDAANTLKYGDFYLDFDHSIETEEDYQKIKADVQRAIRYLTVILSIDRSQIQLYFSGNKGIHITVDADVMGLKPHLALNNVYKEIAKDISKFCENGTLDLAVYDDKRMFRMVNSINKKSGLYKIPITYEEFQRCTIREIKELARKPRTIQKPKPIFSAKAKQQFEKYMEAWSKRLELVKKYEGQIRELKTLPPCIKAMQTKIFRETVDERNNSATALTTFYMQQGISKEEALHRMTIWGEENCQPKLPEKDIQTIVNSVYSHQYRYGCETFKRLSGVCEKDICPLFNQEYNVSDEEGEQHE